MRPPKQLENFIFDFTKKENKTFFQEGTKKTFEYTYESAMKKKKKSSNF